MAAANAPVAMFLGFAWCWAGSVRSSSAIAGAPLLLATAAAVFGIVAGVFLDSPRRWRWDQREKLRPGTQVPRVSPTTQALVAQVPRSLPRRELPSRSLSELAARIEQSTPPGSGRAADGGAARCGRWRALSETDAVRAEAGRRPPSPTVESTS